MLGSGLELKVQGRFVILKPGRPSLGELCNARLEVDDFRVNRVDRRRQRAKALRVRRVLLQRLVLGNVGNLALHSLDALQDSWQMLETRDGLRHNGSRIAETAVAIHEVPDLRAFFQGV